MKKNVGKLLLLIIAISMIFYTVHTFAMFRKTSLGTGTLDTATWNVTRSQSQSGDSIDIYPGGATDNYILIVQSNSEVDVTYKIIISNLPSGVEVDLDNSGHYYIPTDGTLTIQTANTVINYNDDIKTKTHTLTFRATSGASLVAEQEIDIDVEFKQKI